jgi:hypothetical protein
MKSGVIDEVSDGKDVVRGDANPERVLMKE